MAGCPRKASSNECLADVPCDSQSPAKRITELYDARDANLAES